MDDIDPAEFWQHYRETEYYKRFRIRMQGIDHRTLFPLTLSQLTVDHCVVKTILRRMEK